MARLSRRGPARSSLWLPCRWRRQSGHHQGAAALTGYASVREAAALPHRWGV